MYLFVCMYFPISEVWRALWRAPNIHLQSTEDSLHATELAGLSWLVDGYMETTQYRHLDMEYGIA